MKQFPLLAVLALACAACGGGPKPADTLLQQIETLYADGHYAAALDSISALRARFPEAAEARRRALELWDNASLRLAQQDIGRTDSALQATLAQIPAAATQLAGNQLRQRRDSLKARYEALCGVVRMIQKKQQAQQ